VDISVYRRKLSEEIFNVLDVACYLKIKIRILFKKSNDNKYYIRANIYK
jgi:hypothetical protein